MQQTKPEVGTLPYWVQSDVHRLKTLYESAQRSAEQSVAYQLKWYTDKSQAALDCAAENAIQHMLSFHRPFFIEIAAKFERLRGFCQERGLDEWEYLQAAGVPERFARDLAQAQYDLARGLS